jgi:hypothetical protein
MAPRGPSAYMLFTAEHREAARAKLNEGGGKVAVTVVAKELARLWAELDEPAKDEWRRKAEEKLQELNKAQG